MGQMKFRACFGLAMVGTDRADFADTVLNSRFRPESFQEVVEIMRAAGFTFKKEYYDSGTTYKNVWIFESFEMDLPLDVIKAVIDAAAACGLGANRVALGIPERRLVGDYQPEVKKSQAQILRDQEIDEIFERDYG